MADRIIDFKTGMNLNGLYPCPWCQDFYVDIVTDLTYEFAHSVVCDRCGMSGPCARTKIDAALAYNGIAVLAFSATALQSVRDRQLWSQT